MFLIPSGDPRRDPTLGPQGCSRGGWSGGNVFFPHSSYGDNVCPPPRDELKTIVVGTPTNPSKRGILAPLQYARSPKGFPSDTETGCPGLEPPGLTPSHFTPYTDLFSSTMIRSCRRFTDCCSYSYTQGENSGVLKKVQEVDVCKPRDRGKQKTDY